MNNDIQKLIDIVFEVGLTIHQNDQLEKMTKEEVANWISTQLRLCGYDTEPIGSSWGVLKTNK
jgi:hypothetical protein